MTPTVSIVVSNYNASDLINGALESVVTTAGDISYEVILVDDASTDGGFTRVDNKYKEDSRFSFFELTTNVGYSALNVAREHMHGKYIMTLDTDARLLPGTLKSLISFMDSTPNAGAATGNLHYPDGRIQIYYRRLMTPMVGFYTTVFGRFIDKYFLGLRNYSAYHYDDLDVTKVSEVEGPVVACLILRREALDQQILDPAFSYFIDVDLCKRIYNHGFKIYLVPDAKVTHIKSVAVGKWKNTKRENMYYTGINNYFKKHYPSAALVMVPLLWLDRKIRDVLEATVGHVPMR